MIRSGLILMIKDLAGKGKGAGEISRAVGVAENTARKYITQPAKPHGLKGIRKPSKLDSYKPLLQELMNQGIFNCVVLMERIQAKGYNGSLTILKDYVQPFRLAKAAPAVQRYETAPGKQAQMDWGICQFTDSTGKPHHIPAFVMILSNSRVKYVEFTSRCDLRSMERCMTNAFGYFGGIPHEVLTDNMKTVVDHREAGTVIWNLQFADFAAGIRLRTQSVQGSKTANKRKSRTTGWLRKGQFLPRQIVLGFRRSESPGTGMVPDGRLQTAFHHRLDPASAARGGTPVCTTATGRFRSSGRCRQWLSWSMRVNCCTA